MLSQEELQKNLDCLFQQEVERILVRVPYGSHFIDDNQELNEKYYLRHLVETIKRIRMTSKTDALALVRMIDEDYEASRFWGQYTAQEMSHDLLFMKDLRQHGYTEELVIKTEPFQSTTAMVEYLKTKIENIGALPAVAYSLFVEWNSERCSNKVINRVEKKYSELFISGAKAHFRIDENEKHYEMMLNISHRLITKYGNQNVLIGLIKDISNFIEAYFRELYEETIVIHDFN